MNAAYIIFGGAVMIYAVWLFRLWLGTVKGQVALQAAQIENLRDTVAKQYRQIQELRMTLAARDASKLAEDAQTTSKKSRCKKGCK